MPNKNQNPAQTQPKHQAASLSKQKLLMKFKEYLNDFKVWEAEYAGDVPGSLKLKITDYETAISLTEQAIQQELSEKEWLQKLRPLIVLSITHKLGLFINKRPSVGYIL